MKRSLNFIKKLIIILLSFVVLSSNSIKLTTYAATYGSGFTAGYDTGYLCLNSNATFHGFTDEGGMVVANSGSGRKTIYWYNGAVYNGEYLDVLEYFTVSGEGPGAIDKASGFVQCRGYDDTDINRQFYFYKAGTNFTQPVSVKGILQITDLDPDEGWVIHSGMQKYYLYSGNTINVSGNRFTGTISSDSNPNIKMFWMEYYVPAGSALNLTYFSDEWRYSAINYSTNAPTVAVVYNPNGAVNYDDGDKGYKAFNQAVVYGINTNIISNPYTGYRGYQFNGWNTSSNGSGTQYSAGQAAAFYGTTNLYAQWTPLSYTLTVNPNGGAWNNSSAAQSFTLKFRQTKSIPNPVKTGYSHTWNISGTKTTLSGTTLTMGYTNSTLTASWTPKKYTLTLNGNKPSNATATVNLSPTSKTVTYDSAIGTLPNPSLTGWTLDSSWKIDGSDITSSTIWKHDANKTATVTWKANKYTMNYVKGVTDTTINVPDTICVYDSNVTMADASNLKGRTYELVFDTNKPNYINYEPSSVAKITGNLQFNKWVTNVKTNLNSSSGSNTFDSAQVLTKPNFVDGATSNKVTATATWSNKTLNNFVSPSLDEFRFLGWMENEAGTGTKVTSITITPDNSKYNKTLYALWARDISLTFDLNDGNYKSNADNTVLKGTVFNNQATFKFDIVGGLTPAIEVKNTEQINTINAYGTYNSNGENKLYTKVSSDGTVYRFLGWSLNPNATEPDTGLEVFNLNRKTTYTIQNDTTLYAVWEPVLQINFEIDRTLGNLTFEDDTKPVTNLPSLNSSKGEQTMSVIIRPGEQGFYRVDSTGSNNLTFKIAFDTRITDIYTHGDTDSEWFDELNPSTHEDLQSGQCHGLNRQITGIKNFTRKFHIPQYLGTDRSYDTSNPDKTNVPVNKYVAVAVISQPSYYYNTVYGKDEQIIVNINIYISPNNSSDFNNAEDKLPSIISEIRTRIL